MSTRKPTAELQNDAEARLASLFMDLLEGGATVLSFCGHAGIPITMTLNAEGWWPTFRAHYAKRGVVDEARVATDLATWPPIASRVMELRLMQGRA